MVRLFQTLSEHDRSNNPLPLKSILRPCHLSGQYLENAIAIPFSYCLNKLLLSAAHSPQ